MFRRIKSQAAQQKKRQRCLKKDILQYPIRADAILVFLKQLEEALEAASESYKKIRMMSVEDKEKVISQIRKLILEDAEIMAKIGVEKLEWASRP